MPARRIDVFFYGLFMDADLLRSKGLNPVNIRPACVRGRALQIGKRATLVSRPEGRTYGILMALTHTEIEQLYAEASVSAYRPERVLAELTDGSTVPAECYTLPAPPGSEETDPAYAKKLRDLATRLGLPYEYVSTIH